MPTGLTNSPSLFGPGVLYPSNIPQKVQPEGPRAAVNVTITTVLVTTGLPKNCSPFSVPPGATVNVRGQNGTSGGNTDAVFVGLNLEELANGGGRMITPDTEIFYPVDNTCQIWVRGTAGDGIQVTITANPE